MLLYVDDSLLLASCVSSLQFRPVAKGGVLGVKSLHKKLGLPLAVLADFKFQSLLTYLHFKLPGLSWYAAGAGMISNYQLVTVSQRDGLDVVSAVSMCGYSSTTAQRCSSSRWAITELQNGSLPVNVNARTAKLHEWKEPSVVQWLDHCRLYYMLH